MGPGWAAVVGKRSQQGIDIRQVARAGINGVDLSDAQSSRAADEAVIHIEVRRRGEFLSTSVVCHDGVAKGNITQWGADSTACVLCDRAMAGVDFTLESRNSTTQRAAAGDAITAYRAV